jgi:hypothetical protein
VKKYWTVTWPTTPNGIITAYVGKQARTVAEAIADARSQNTRTAPGYSIDYTAEPEVWQLIPGPARRVSGPDWETNCTRATG